jgi:eukaryotic-like serine/threonine-protein kinase
MNYLNPGYQLQNNRFVIQKTLNSEESEITYLAHDTLMDKKVSIRTLYSIKFTEVDFNNEHQSFLAKSRRLAQSNHPNLVRVLDIFYAETEKLWCMVTEYIIGQNLEEIVNSLYGSNRFLSQQEALSYIQQIGAALTAVHTLGILHCNLAPRNILRQAQTDRIILNDFGLMREFDLNKSQRVNNFRIKGYAPPERYKHQNGFTPTLDVYAIASIFYTLLTGVIPIDSIFRKDYSLKTPQQLKSDISDEINTAIMKGMEMEPRNRPQSVAEFLTLLQVQKGLRKSSGLKKSQSKLAIIPDIINYYQILDLQPEWDVDKLRKTLRRALSESQSRINAAKGDKKKQLEYHIKLIQNATKTLLDPEKKERYDQEL